MITLLQLPPEVKEGQIWTGIAAKPNFHYRKVKILAVNENDCTVQFTKEPKDIVHYEKTMFSNIITGFAYFSTDNKYLK